MRNWRRAPTISDLEFKEKIDDRQLTIRHGPPLAVGHGTDEMYLGSDALALAPLSRRITYLEEGDRAVITGSDWTTNRSSE